MFETPFMPGSPYMNNTFETRDPLATSYMTGGTMGYMPDAQFLTPVNYGAFRTLPNSNFVTGQQYNPNLWQSILIRNYGFGGIFDTYNPSVNSLRRHVMAQRNINSAFASVGSAGFETLAGVGAGLMVGGIPGLVAGTAASVLASTVAAPWIDRMRTTRDIQNVTMGKITSGTDLAAGLGQGFSASAAKRIDRSIRHMAAGDLVFNREDYNNILQLGIDNGLFDYANNADQYIRTLKTLRSNFEVMMGLFETMDMRGIAQQMQRLQSMGANINDMSTIAGFEKTYARMSGMAHAEFADSIGQQGAMIYNNYGLTGYQGALQNMSAYAKFEMAKRMGILSPDLLSRMGGVSGAAQSATEGQAKVDNLYREFMTSAFLADDKFALDPNKILNYVNGKESRDLIQMSRDRASSLNPKQFALLDTYGADLLSNIKGSLTTEQNQLLTLRVALDLANNLGLNTLEEAFSVMGLSPEERRALAMSYSPEALAGLKQNLSTSQRTLSWQIQDRLKAKEYRGIFLKIGQAITDKVNSVTDPLLNYVNARNDVDEGVSMGEANLDSAYLLDRKKYNDLLGDLVAGKRDIFSHKEMFNNASNGNFFTNLFGMKNGGRYSYRDTIFSLGNTDFSNMTDKEYREFRDALLAIYGGNSDDLTVDKLKELMMDYVNKKGITGEDIVQEKFLGNFADYLNSMGYIRGNKNVIPKDVVDNFNALSEEEKQEFLSKINKYSRKAAGTYLGGEGQAALKASVHEKSLKFSKEGLIALNKRSNDILSNLADFGGDSFSTFAAQRGNGEPIDDVTILSIIEEMPPRFFEGNAGIPEIRQWLKSKYKGKLTESDINELLVYMQEADILTVGENGMVVSSLKGAKDTAYNFFSKKYGTDRKTLSAIVEGARKRGGVFDSTRRKEAKGFAAEAASLSVTSAVVSLMQNLYGAADVKLTEESASELLSLFSTGSRKDIEEFLRGNASYTESEKEQILENLPDLQKQLKEIGYDPKNPNRDTLSKGMGVLLGSFNRYKLNNEDALAASIERDNLVFGMRGIIDSEGATEEEKASAKATLTSYDAVSQMEKLLGGPIDRLGYKGLIIGIATPINQLTNEMRTTNQLLRDNFNNDRTPGRNI